MAKLRFTNKAVEDLTSIWNYTFKTWSERQADEYYEMLISACRRILVSSLVPARLYTEISPDLYGVKAGYHLIFFKTIICSLYRCNTACNMLSGRGDSNSQESHRV